MDEPIDAYNHCIDAMRYVSIMKLANQQKIQIIDRGRLGISLFLGEVGAYWSDTGMS